MCRRTALRLHADVPLGCGSQVNQLTSQPSNFTARERIIQGGEVMVHKPQSLSTGWGVVSRLGGAEGEAVHICLQGGESL